MQAIRSQNTKPELTVRHLLHTLGYRYRLYRKDLPGKPDIVFPGRRRIIEVRGCFFHGHGCRLGQPAKTRTEYWGPKIEANRNRDAANVAALRAAGWEVLELWECEIRAGVGLAERLESFLGPPRGGSSVVHSG